MAASAAWIGAEIVVGSAIMLTAFITAELWGWPKDTESLAVVAYLPGLFAGLVAAEVVKHYLVSRPVLTEEPQREIEN